MNAKVRDTAQVRLSGTPQPLVVRPRKPPQRGSQADLLQKVHPLVLARALELAGGDKRRLAIGPDGSVTIRNRPR